MATERIQKVLSSRGVASRREAEELVAQGLVTVNGVTAEPGQKVDATVDMIAVRGEVVSDNEGAVYIVLNKPTGFVSSLKSTHGERTILDLVDIGRRVYPVGRLDRDTSGVLLLTDDGDWANLIAHPRYNVQKEYVATVQGRPSRETIQHLQNGVQLPDGTVTTPATVRMLPSSGADARLSITLVQGKKRQIRLMAAAVGHPVLELRRIRVDGIELGNLALGAWRYLTKEEVEGIRVDVRDKRAQPGGQTIPRDSNRRRSRFRKVDSWKGPGP